MTSPTHKAMATTAIMSLMLVASPMALVGTQADAQSLRTTNSDYDYFRPDGTFGNPLIHENLNNLGGVAEPGPSTYANQTAEPKVQPIPRCTRRQRHNCDTAAQLMVQAPYLLGGIFYDAGRRTLAARKGNFRKILDLNDKLDTAQNLVDSSEDVKDLAVAKCLELIVGCDHSPRKRSKSKTSNQASNGTQQVAEVKTLNQEVSTSDLGSQLDSDGYEFERDEPDHFAWYDYADDQGIHTQSVDSSTYGEGDFGSDDPYELDLDEIDKYFNSDGSDFNEGEAFNEVWEEAEASQQHNEVQVEDVEQRTAAQEFFGDFDEYSDEEYSDDYEDRKFREMENARFEEIRRELESLESAIRNNEKAHFGRNLGQMLSDHGHDISQDGSYLGETQQRLMPNSTLNSRPNRKDPRERPVRQPLSYRDNPNLIYSPVATPESIKQRISPPKGRRCMECTSPG